MEKKYSARLVWQMRIIVGAIILICSFVGLVIGDLGKGDSWFYWRWMGPVFALLCLFLSWFLRQRDQSLSFATIWHELLHWVGVLAAVYLISFFARIGILGSIEESLVVMIILALGIFLIGIYVEWSLAFVGVILAIFAAGAALAQDYLYTIMLPIFIVALLLLGFFVFFLHKRGQSPKA